MSKFLKMFGVVALFGALMMAGGCGGGGDDDQPVVTNPSVTSPIAATVNANGTATTGATPTTVNTPNGTTGYLATVKVDLPANTVITAKNADGTTKVLTAPPSFTFIAPADSTATKSGTNGVPVPTGRLAVASTSGAVDLQLTGAASATFASPITITMAVPGKTAGEVLPVYTVTGSAYTLLVNPANPLGWPVAPAGFISFPVSSLSWKVCNPVFTTATGSTGSPGGSI